MRRCLLVAVAAIAVACGSSASRPGTGGPGPDAGTVSGGPGDGGAGGGAVDAGSPGGSGGSADAGSGGGSNGGGSDDGGSNGGGSSGGGGGSGAGGSPGDAGPDDGGTAGGGTADAGGAADAGALSADCTNLIPPEGNPSFVVDLNVGRGVCSMSRPDDLQSTIPLSRSTDGSARDFFFFDSTTGKGVGQLHTGDQGPFGLLAQPHAYTGISFTGLFPNFTTTVFGYSHTGEPTTVTHAGRNPVWNVDPGGGTVGIDLETAPGDSTVTYFRFDKDNVLERRVTVPGLIARMAFPVVSLHEGDTLVVFTRDFQACSGTWLDREGNQVTAAFALPSCHLANGFPLLDGGLVLADEEPVTVEIHLRYQIADRATTVTAAPDWLLERTPRDFFLLPGGKGYAFRAASTDRTIELRAPAGNLCGRWDRPELGNGPLLIGRDGTLVVQDFRGPGCTFSWWTQLFR